MKRKEGDSMKREARQLIGYLVGGALVLGLIPYGLYRGGAFLDTLLGGPLHISPGILVPAALLFFCAGAVFGVWSVVIQNTRGDGGPVQLGKLDISPRTRHLVVTGPYRFTRNPMLFGAFLMYLGFSIVLGSAGAILLTLAFAAFMLAVVVPSEEKRLLADFGGEYRAYRSSVPRFFPRKPRKEAP
jgi:protein-S-isoprenylcysteine O-methyltransferase Ste14